MHSAVSTFQFLKNNSTVVFNDRIIEDLNQVSINLKARVYSAFQRNSPYVETRRRFFMG